MPQKDISIREMVTIMQKKEIKATLLGIGPMSELVIAPPLSLAEMSSFLSCLSPAETKLTQKSLVADTSSDRDQMAFAQAIRKIADDVNFDGLLYLCRDHGGPWQRDNEKNDKLPPKEAMEKAKASYLDDLKAGFNLLHIDPTKDPHVSGGVSMDTVIEKNN